MSETSQYLETPEGNHALFKRTYTPSLCLDHERTRDMTGTLSRGQGRAGERGMADQGVNGFVLGLPKGVIPAKKFVIENDVPDCRTHFSMWNNQPLPLEREVLDPRVDEQLFRPTPEEEDWLAFECDDYTHAVECAEARLDHYRILVGLVGRQGTRVKYNTRGSFVTIVNPANRLPNVRAGFYYDGVQPPKRNLLDAVLEQRQPTQAEALCGVRDWR